MPTKKNDNRNHITRKLHCANIGTVIDYFANIGNGYVSLCRLWDHRQLIFFEWIVFYDDIPLVIIVILQQCGVEYSSDVSHIIGNTMNGARGARYRYVVSILIFARYFSFCFQVFL
jgi:hypothetical protein